MSRLTIHNNRCNNATIISNQFIDNYMKEANDAQLKIYLYLLRMTSTDNFTSISEIVEKFNHTEKDVIRSLQYWETKELLSLDYNKSGALISISLKELKEDSANIPLSTGETKLMPNPSIIEQQLTKSVANFVELPPIEATTETEVANDISQLYYVIEQYLGKTLTRSDIDSIIYITEELHFSHNLIDYLVQYCVDRGKKSFRYIETVARNWYDQNITTPEEAASISVKYTNTIYSVMKALGKSNTEPTELEISFIKQWSEEFKFSLEIIYEACNRTVQNTNSNRFKYAHSILTNWHNKQISTLTDIEDCDRKYQQSNSSKTYAPTANKKKSFNQFEQNTYDYEQLEAQIFQNQLRSTKHGT